MVHIIQGRGEIEDDDDDDGSIFTIIKKQHEHKATLNKKIYYKFNNGLLPFKAFKLAFFCFCF